MKKLTAMLLTAVMLLSMISVPAFAAAVDVEGICDDFESKTLDTATWRNDKYAAVDKKATSENADNYALKLCDSNGQAHFDSYNKKNMTIKGRGIFEFDLLVESLRADYEWAFLNFIGIVNSAGTNSNSITADLLAWKNGKLYVYGNETAATDLALNTWKKIRVDLDVDMETYKVYVDDVILETTNGVSEFSFGYAGNSQIALSGGTVQRVRIDTSTQNKTSPTTVWFDNVNYRPAIKADTNGNCISITSASVGNGDVEVDIKPQLTYTFSHELNPDTLKNISLNDDSSYIKSVELLSDKKTLNITLDRNLSYGTEYTLDFGFVEAAYGSLISEIVTFTTLNGTNLVFDDFEDASVDTNKWRITGNAVGELKTDPLDNSNKALYLASTTTDGKQFDNYQKISANMPGDVLVEFDMMIDSASERQAFNLFNLITSSINTLMQFQKMEDSSYNIVIRNPDDGNLTSSLMNVKSGQWYTYSFVADPVGGAYKFYLDNELVTDDYSLYNTSDDDKVTQVRFSLYKGDEFYGLYLDNFKIARNMWMTEGGFYNAEGEEIDTVDPEDTIYKAKIINRAPVDENLVLYLAQYTADGKELKSVITKSVTVPARKSADIEHHFQNLGGAAYTTKIKVIYVKDEDSIEPYRAALGLNAQELCAGTAPVDVTATLSLGESVASVYPGGHYKAVTMRFDDGKVWDTNVLEIMNKNGLKGTFYLIAKNVKEGNSANYITADSVKEVYAGHEIASHSWDHTLENISLANLTEAREYLETVWGDDVIGYAYPSSNLYPNSPEIAKNKATYLNLLAQSGHVYANNSLSDIATQTLTQIPDISKPFETISYRMLYTDFEDAVKAYAANTDKTLSLLFTMQHSSDFVANGEFDSTIMNTFVQNIANRKDIWYCTNGEVITYLMAKNEMNVPATGSSITINETTKTLWYMVGDELVSVVPGSRLVITEE